MIDKEEKLSGAVPLEIYTKYLKSSGLLLIIVIFFFYIASQVVKVLSDWWLGRWLQNSYG